MKNYMFSLTVLLMGCSLFKNTQTATQSSRQLTTDQQILRSTEQRDWLIRSGNVTFYKDTNNLDYAIQIWPKGVFAFSREKGFIGEADKIMVRGNKVSTSVLAGSNTLEQQDKGSTEINLNQKQKKITKLKDKLKTSSSSWKLIIAGICLVVILGWVLIKNFFKK